MEMSHYWECPQWFVAWMVCLALFLGLVNAPKLYNNGKIPYAGSPLNLWVNVEISFFFIWFKSLISWLNKFPNYRSPHDSRPMVELAPPKGNCKAPIMALMVSSIMKVLSTPDSIVELASLIGDWRVQIRSSIMSSLSQKIDAILTLHSMVDLAPFMGGEVRVRKAKDMKLSLPRVMSNWMFSKDLKEELIVSRCRLKPSPCRYLYIFVYGQIATVTVYGCWVYSLTVILLEVPILPLENFRWHFNICLCTCRNPIIFLACWKVDEIVFQYILKI